MATTQPEARLVKKIMQYLKTVPDCCAEKRHGTNYGKAGQPDISGCVLVGREFPGELFKDGFTRFVTYGQRFEIEVKMPGNDPTDLQDERLREWGASGAWAIVAHSLSDVQKMMETILGRKP